MVHLIRRTTHGAAGSLGRSSGLAVIVAVLLLACAVLPASAGNGPADLASPAVSPETGTTATPITFSVTFRSAKGQAPDYVQVVVGSKTFRMERTAGEESWKNGVRYRVTRKLPAGRWATRFEASDGAHELSVAGPTVRITVEPTPKPTPRPTPRPTAKPTPRPTPDPTPKTPASPSPAAASHTPPVPRPDFLAIALIPGAGGAGGSGSEGSGGSGSGGSGPLGPDGHPGGTAAGGAVGSLPGGLGGSSSLAATVARVMPTVVVTTGGVTMLMAFLAFGRRRRDEEPTASDDDLAAAAGRGIGLPGYSGLIPDVAASAYAAPGGLAGPAAVGIPYDADGHLPRWRRPSLLEARKADPLRSVSTSARLSFDDETQAAAGGLERRLIRYRLVSLLDAPDEVRGVEIGSLDEGDEVMLLEKRGTYWRVLCPDGREGWIHKMTLGDVVIEAGPETASSWTAGDDGPAAAGNFEDMLRTYLDGRQQFGEQT